MKGDRSTQQSSTAIKPLEGVLTQQGHGINRSATVENPAPSSVVDAGSAPSYTLINPIHAATPNKHPVEQNAQPSLACEAGDDLTISMVMSAASTAAGVLSDGVPDQLHKAMQDPDDDQSAQGVWSGYSQDSLAPPASAESLEFSLQQRHLSDEYGLELYGGDALFPKGFSSRLAEVMEKCGAKTTRL